jgi:hypothetical protein
MNNALLSMCRRILTTDVLEDQIPEYLLAEASVLVRDEVWGCPNPKADSVLNTPFENPVC